MQRAMSHDREAFHDITLASGLRVGKLHALRWREVDLEQRRLRVAATYSCQSEGESVIAETKMARVTLPNAAVRYRRGSAASRQERYFHDKALQSGYHTHGSCRPSLRVAHGSNLLIRNDMRAHDARPY